jgi:hypothetical protein
VQPDGDPDGRPLVVRTTGGPQLTTGSRVAITAHGPVQAWARE